MSQPPTHADRWLEADDDFVRPVSRAGARPDGVPEWIGPYRVLRVLGQGAAGLVVLAERDERQVAVKVLLDLSAEAQARFQVEARVAAKLRDPGLVPVYDVGSFEGRPYYVMEYCPGVTLQEHLRARGRLEPSEAARLVRELARTLGVAHAQGILHRDLKPANVILTDAGPRITDFGVGRDRGEVGSLTRSHDVLGTPLYMAPETFEGSKFVDARSDVYALGVILYECLTGRRPYEGGSVLELSQRVRRGDAAPVRVLAPAVPRRLEAACMRALARQPEDRFADARALRAALDEFLADPRGSDAGPLAATAPTQPRAAPATVPLRRAAVPVGPTALVLGALALASVTILGSALWLVLGRREAPTAPSPVASVAEVPPRPDFGVALADCARELDGDSLGAWERALAQAQLAVRGPQDQARLDDLLAQAFDARFAALGAAMREVAAFDRALVERAAALTDRFPDRAGPVTLLLGDYFRRRARYPDGLDCAQRLLELGEPALAAEAYRLQLLCRWRKGDSPQAWLEPLEALIACAGTPGSEYGRGVKALLSGNTGAALEAADRCLQLDPGYTCAKILRVWALGHGGNAAQAEAYEQTFQEAEDDPYLLLERMRRILQEGMRHQALVMAQRLGQLLDGNDPEARETLRRLDRFVQDVSRANQEATRALHGDPGNQAALFRRGITALVLGELSHAAGDLRDARRLDPERFEVLVREERNLTEAERAWVADAAR